jgi:hypothetical protein
MLTLAKAMANLEKSVVSRSEQPLHVQLWRCGQKPVFALERYDMLLWSHGRHADGRFYLKKALFPKESACMLVDRCSALQIRLDAKKPLVIIF